MALFGEETGKYLLSAGGGTLTHLHESKHGDPDLTPPPLVSAAVWPRSDCGRHHGASGPAQDLHDQRRLGLRRPHRADRSGRGHFLHRLLRLLRRLEGELLHGYHGNGATVPAI